MLDNIQSILRDTCKLDKARPILAGVSGGPDSLCLLSLLLEAGWQVIAAHFNHMLRPEAEEDAAAVEEVAAQMGVPFVGGKGDVRAYAAQAKLSIETAARELRYRFLFEQARLHRAQAVAVGHTADDQVETVLMHFIRGAGMNGMKGMEFVSLPSIYGASEFHIRPLADSETDHPGNILLVHPLLDYWRTDTVEYCASHGLKPHYDASNDSREFLRNRIRHELIPSLETYNPRFRETVWRSARAWASDYEIIRGTIEPIVNQALLRCTARYASLDTGVLHDLSQAAQVHVLRIAAKLLVPEIDPGYDDFERAVAFIRKRSQEREDFIGGLTLLREEGALYITLDKEIPVDAWPQLPLGHDSIDFSPSCLVSLEAKWSFAALKYERTLGTEYELSWETLDTREAYLDADTLPVSLQLRIRRDGDRFEPLGMDGHSQKLSDFFVNVKLPARARARWPLVCAGDEIIWVPGYRPAHRHRLQPGTKNILYLAVKPPSLEDTPTS